MGPGETFPCPDLDAAPLAPFWRAAQECQLHMPVCAACGRIDWYPKGACRNCGGADITWRPLSGQARLFSWAVVNRALDPRLAGIAPYVSAIVTPEEDSNARFVTRIVDAPPALLAAEMALCARFLDLGYPALKTGIIAPFFAPAG